MAQNGKMTLEEATRKWVSEFSAIPIGVVEKLLAAGDEIEEVTPRNEDDEDEPYDFLPMWGTMWCFGDSLDDWWLENEGGLKLMAKCGFRIYRQEDYGYIFGIDGAGYDFYEVHWIPLYKARGLRWHNEEDNK